MRKSQGSQASANKQSAGTDPGPAVPSTKLRSSTEEPPTNERPAAEESAEDSKWDHKMLKPDAVRLVKFQEQKPPLEFADTIRRIVCTVELKASALAPTDHGQVIEVLNALMRTTAQGMRQFMYGVLLGSSRMQVIKATRRPNNDIKFEVASTNDKGDIARCLVALFCAPASQLGFVEPFSDITDNQFDIVDAVCPDGNTGASTTNVFSLKWVESHSRSVLKMFQPLKSGADDRFVSISGPQEITPKPQDLLGQYDASPRAQDWVNEVNILRAAAAAAKTGNGRPHLPTLLENGRPHLPTLLGFGIANLQPFVILAECGKPIVPKDIPKGMDIHTIAKQLVDAVWFLHSLGYAHRDISLNNILLVDEERVLLIDFGFATKIQNLKTGECGTEVYCGARSTISFNMANMLEVAENDKNPYPSVAFQVEDDLCSVWMTLMAVCYPDDVSIDNLDFINWKRRGVRWGQVRDYWCMIGATFAAKNPDKSQLGSAVKYLPSHDQDQHEPPQLQSSPQDPRSQDQDRVHVTKHVVLNNFMYYYYKYRNNGRVDEA
jgi:hypothetical protein